MCQREIELDSYAAEIEWKARRNEMNEIGKVTEMRKPVLKFAEAMENKLRKHDHDRGYSGWRDTTYTPSWFFERLEMEVKELNRAINHSKRPYSKKTVESIRRECTDVANFAMMIFDKMDDFYPE